MKQEAAIHRAFPAKLASSLPSIETIEAELSVDLETEAAS